MMKIRSAIVSDAEVISRIRVSAWQAAYEKFMPKTFLANLDPLENLDSLSKYLLQQNDSFQVFVAEVDSSVVAFSIIGAPRYPTNPKVLELWALNVHPSLWRQGVGRALISHTVDAAILLDFKSIELWCIHGNYPAGVAYESCGFSVTGEERSTTKLTGHHLHEILYARLL